jgi:hypothetical protein
VSRGQASERAVCVCEAVCVEKGARRPPLPAAVVCPPGGRRRRRLAITADLSYDLMDFIRDSWHTWRRAHNHVDGANEHPQPRLLRRQVSTPRAGRRPFSRLHLPTRSVRQKGPSIGNEHHIPSLHFPFVSHRSGTRRGALTLGRRRHLIH